MSSPDQPSTIRSSRWEWLSESLSLWSWLCVAVTTILLSTLFLMIYAQVGESLGWPIPQWMLMSFDVTRVVGLIFIVPAAAISILAAKYIQYRMQGTEE